MVYNTIQHLPPHPHPPPSTATHYWTRIFKRLWSQESIPKKSIPPASETRFLNVYGARNRFQRNHSASLWSSAGRYGNPIPTRFLGKIPGLYVDFGKGGGELGEVREKVEEQQFTRGVENTNMPDCISSLKNSIKNQ